LEIWLFLVSAAIGYFLGSISFARIGLKLAGADRDITELIISVGSTDETTPVEIFGANAASMILGAKGGIAIGIMDMLKIGLPMAIFRFLLFPGDYYHLVISVAGLMGHNWPIYYGFKGGRGFSVIFGSLVVVDWLGAVTLPVMGTMFGLFVVGNMLVGYISWLIFLIPWLWVRTFDYVYLIYAFLIAVFFGISVRPEVSAINKYRKEGKLEEYQKGLYDSSPRWRGMRRMQERVDALGRARYLIGLIVLIAIILVFLTAGALPF
jgi:glycerol-3-phosphate acyltransferase PlsY